MEKNSLRNQLDTTPDYIDILVAAAKLRGVKVFQLGTTIRFERQSFFNFIENNSRVI